MTEEIERRPSRLVSQREAVAHFVEQGLDRETARRVLVSGFVHPAHRMRRATLYRERDVLDFIDRQRTEPPSWKEQLVVVFRAQPRRDDPDSPVGWSDVDLTAPAAEQLVAARAGGRGMSALTRAYVALLAQRDGCVPMLVTVGGFVALAAEILGHSPPGGAEERSPVWELRPAGEWAEEWLGRHLPTGRGGSSWRVLGPRSNAFVSRAGQRVRGTA